MPIFLKGKWCTLKCFHLYTGFSEHKVWSEEILKIKELVLKNCSLSQTYKNNNRSKYTSLLTLVASCGGPSSSPLICSFSSCSAPMTKTSPFRQLLMFSFYQFLKIHFSFFLREKKKKLNWSGNAQRGAAKRSLNVQRAGYVKPDPSVQVTGGETGSSGGGAHGPLPPSYG